MSVVLSSSHGDKRLHVDDDGQVEDDEAHLLRRMTVMVIQILTTVGGGGGGGLHCDCSAQSLLRWSVPLFN